MEAWFFRLIIGYTLVIVCSIISGTLLTGYCYKVLCDLSPKTAKRSTAASKRLAIFTLISVLCFTMPLGWSLLLCWSLFAPLCLIGNLFGSTSWAIGKIFMYFIFLLRLDLIYGETVFQYKPRNLKIIAVVAAFNHTLGIIFNLSTMRFHGANIDGIFIVKCIVTLNPLVLSYAALVDIIFCIGFIVAFIVPLKQISKQMKDVDVTTNKNVMKAGTKAMILTCTSAGSTLVFLVISGLYPYGIHVLFQVELTINAVSLLLMAKYYKNSKYFNYNRICCCMIWCCQCYTSAIDEEMIDNEQQNSNNETVETNSPET